MHTNRYFIYIMASPGGTLYVGVTNGIYLRVAQHKADLHPKSFTSRYRCKKLLMFEPFWDPADAIAMEKQIKHWSREKKERLIKKYNPGWRDLSETWDLPEVKKYDS